MSLSSIKNLAPSSLVAQLPPEGLPSSSSLSSSTGLLARRIGLEDADKVMDSVADLLQPTDPYRPKYFKALYRMGPALFLELADRARKGKYPQHLFRRLIDGPKREFVPDGR